MGTRRFDSGTVSLLGFFALFLVLLVFGAIEAVGTLAWAFNHVAWMFGG